MGKDYRKSTDNKNNAKKVMQEIVGNAPDKNTSKKLVDKLKKVCSDAPHKGCRFVKKGSDFEFQPLDNNGEPEGKIYKLSSWIQKNI